MNEIGYPTITKRGSNFIRDTVDEIYTNENYHCCSTDLYQIYHVGTCCPGTCEKPCCAKEKTANQLISCSEFWKSKSLRALHMRHNDFFKLLKDRGAAGCIMQIRNCHFVWGHGTRIYDKQVPDDLVDELVAAAKSKNLYTRSPVVALWVNDKMPA